MEDGSESVELIKNNVSLVEKGSGHYGCSHYLRRCKIIAPCCGEIFDCRHCHNEAKDSLETDLIDRHEIPRHEVTKVICSLCNTEQDVHQYCINCGVCMGKYFCAKCKLFDDEVSKNQYHCDDCGICRTGGKENYFHCKKCDCCYSVLMKDNHACVERAMHHNCPVCFEFLFDTLKDITVLHCGHTLHLDCLRNLTLHYRYTCPVCSKSICDMSNLWKKIDEEIASTPMPSTFLNKMVCRFYATIVGQTPMSSSTLLRTNAKVATPTILGRYKVVILLHAHLRWLLRWLDDYCWHNGL
ncbi:zf-CHY domain-containing protein/zf-RING_2 domain-containing protein [Cephalotus follicularis]|uniref:Zf-CHY domain-containing protein/zf-RING_2 domain-containing protein n=1 Tax=Cephalotus follicularis TaxID=3775 RepID=A0A1Q3C023_CEPFO|nr:zf-CHY domain-containing protein/zf-RING_2 domain-containing protein [Cephalotus follicularis]